MPDLIVSKIGQSQMEGLLLFILILGVVIPLLFYATSELNSVFRMNQADDSLRSVAITSNAVRNLGSGNSNVVAISVPNGVHDFYVDENVIVYVIDGFELKVDMGGEVVGDVPSEPGIHHVKITSLEYGKVKLGENPYISEVNPGCVARIGGVVSLVGADFDEGGQVYVDGAGLNSELYEWVDYGKILLNIDESVFYGSQDGKFYDVQIKSSEGVFSNSVIFLVKLSDC
tara:strand:- start:3058 stop:3744 length:687 start_codon:yes stop_codon:yes gene_type:complete